MGKNNNKINWSLVIAIIAIVISLAHLYFNYFRKYNDLKATILNFRVNSYSSDFITDIVFTNNGNIASSIVAINIKLKNIDEKHEAFKGGEYGFPFLGNLPFSVRPGEVISQQFIRGDGELEVSSYGKKNERINCYISFGIVDSKGRYHKIKTPVCYLISGEDNKMYPEPFPKIVKLLPSRIENSDYILPIKKR